MISIQVGLEGALVPLGEDVGNLTGVVAQSVAEEVVRLADELHVGVLDAVVHHLDEVTAAVGADVRAARGAVDVSGDGLEEAGREPRRTPSGRPA